MRQLASIALGLVLGVTIGCSRLPTQEMSDARQAIAAAREVGAPSFATAEIQNAQRLLDEAQSALEQGDYDRSRERAVAAKKAAVQARKQALNEKQQVEQD